MRGFTTNMVNDFFRSAASASGAALQTDAGTNDGRIGSRLWPI